MSIQMGAGRRAARFLGLVCSTTECGLAAASEDGEEAYVGMPMAGAVQWRGCAAFDLDVLPGMVLELLNRLSDDGWDVSQPGHLSQSWRQHDLVLSDGDGDPLIPALSWQCNGARAETEALNGLAGFRAAVGTVEERFIAPKLPWALAQEPDLRERLHAVMTSGDWLAGRLTGGHFRLSASDALSNGLLDQNTKQLAAGPLRQAGGLLGGRLRPEWFPPVIASSGVIGTVETAAAPPWRELCERLRGWKVAAMLGDNHASAAGCGAAEYDTMVLSLGTSGTVNLPAPHGARPTGDVLGFEYWDDRLFLLMLTECGAWYERFRAEAAPTTDYEELNRMALGADLERIVRVEAGRTAADAGLDLLTRVASVHCSIALEMLDRVRTMLGATAEPIRTFVLTGGLSRAPLIREALYAGLRMLAETDDRVAEDARILLNDRSGPLAYKTDALGALVNARVAAGGKGARQVIAADRSWRPCEAPPADRGRLLRRLLQSLGGTA